MKRGEMKEVQSFYFFSQCHPAFLTRYGHGQRVEATGGATNCGRTVQQWEIKSAHTGIPVARIAGRLRKRGRRQEALLLVKLARVPENKRVRPCGGGAASAG